MAIVPNAAVIEGRRGRDTSLDGSRGGWLAGLGGVMPAPSRSARALIEGMLVPTATLPYAS